LTAIRC